MLIDSLSALNTTFSASPTYAPTWSKYLFPPFNSLAVEYLHQRHIWALNIGSILPNLDPKILLAIQCAMLHQEMIGWHEAMISYVKSGGYSGLADSISQVDKSTLILWGETDDMLPLKDAEKFHQDIAHSRLVKLKNCGHTPQIEQPQITSQHIFQFLNSGKL